MRVCVCPEEGEWDGDALGEASTFRVGVLGGNGCQAGEIEQ